MPSIYDLQDAYDGSLTTGWHKSRWLGSTKRRPYMIAAGPGGRYRNRHRWKRGGRWKKSKARTRCLKGQNPEKKFLDSANEHSPTVTGAVALISAIPQGDGESERIGRKATITNIMFKGHLELGTVATEVCANRVRICIVVDHSTNGVAFVASDVFNTAGTGDIDAYRDLSLVGRFRVLYDKTFTINPQLAGNGTAEQSAVTMRAISGNVKCCIPIEYDASAATGAITTQQVNSIHFVMFEEVASPDVVFHRTVRIRYVG